MNRAGQDGRNESTARNVPALLLELRAEHYSGTVQVSGAPGGAIHMRNGLVAAVETPGAPTAETALLKSGRIDDEAWLAARAADREGGRLGAELVSRGFVGAAELEVICTAAVFDGAFAMALGTPGGWEVTERTPTIVTAAGIEPRRLMEETSRRVAVLSRLWGPPSELARVRVRPVPPVGPSSGAVAQALADRHQDIIAGVNGRRTARDIAFALGRGLYPVMLDLVRMEAQGLVQWDDRTAGVGRPSTAPRTAASSVARKPSGTSAGAGPLPRRTPGAVSPRGAGGDGGKSGE
ncbi:hypothetical protein [Wenjunlia tyrosinilytica]|uniref:DUF4388 domain-containing protein n=1 Tax=Wenjunlia tyrosinilytica TaxID=1544741 RepID=A0A917ZQ41_9ACTN|nr:hypothetical protein [Wenjunlia tyrosinilytica]GGO88497.1 hypothetical protein GCM10012280_29460 [Wenjunlia tyrosinilytica]